MLLQPVTIYEIVDEPTTQTTIADVLLGVAGMVFALGAVALVLGLLCAGLLIKTRQIRRHRKSNGSSDDATQLGLNQPS